MVLLLVLVFEVFPRGRIIRPEISLREKEASNRPELVIQRQSEKWDQDRVGVLLVGENQKIDSAEATVRRLRRVAPQVRAEIIPNAGHDLTMVQADLVVSKVLGFLGERAGAAAPAA